MKNIIFLTMIMGFSVAGFAQKADSTKTGKITLRGVNATDALEPLIVIDGNKQYIRGTSALNEINPDNIKSISIYKDNVALTKYGADGLAGVIEIKTKNNEVGSYGLKNKPIKPSGLYLKGKVSGFGVRPAIPDPNTTIKKRYLLNRDFDPKAKPLYIVDGKEVADLDLNEEAIESIEVLKDSTSIKLYGDKGKNGVLIITTKKSKPAQKKN